MFERSNITTNAEFAKTATGIILGDIGAALELWAVMNTYGGNLSVAHAAVCFNTSVDIIKDVVNGSTWGSLNPANETDPAKQIIYVDSSIFGSASTLHRQPRLASDQ